MTPTKRRTRRFAAILAVGIAFYAVVLTGCTLTRVGFPERPKTPRSPIRDYATQDEAPTWLVEVRFAAGRNEGCL